MKKPASPLSKYARFSGMVIQMGVIIGLFTWLGLFLDEKYHTKQIWTITLSLLGVFLSLYLLIKEVIKTSHDDQ